jgi:hypothetical protein
MIMDSRPTTDVQHLKLLKIFHYIWGSFCCLLGLVAIVYIRFGEDILKSFERVRSPAGENLPLMFGQFFIVASIFDFVMLECAGVLSLITAGKYGSKTCYRLCFAASIFNCILMPIGTALGVFALFVLCRPSVKALFNQKDAR